MKYLSILLILLTYCSTADIQNDNVAEKEKNTREAEINKRAAADLFIKGSTSEMKGEIAEAILDYIEAAKLDPQPGIYYAIGKGYYMLQKLPAAIRNTKTAVQMAPGENEYKMLLAEIYDSAFLPDSAEVLYEDVISNDSTNFNAIYNLASIYEKNKPMQALELYKKIIDKNGNDWSVLIKIAELNERMGNVDQTISTVKTLLALNPSNTDLKKMLIESLIKTNRIEEADSMINESLVLFPDDINLIEYKASILAQQEKWDEAKEEYLKIINDKSIELKAKIGIGARFLAQSVSDSSALSCAKDIFTAIEKDTSDWQVNMYLGQISLQEKDDSSAIRYFKKAATNASWNAESWIRLGGLLFDNHRYSEAANEMEIAVKSFPDDNVINLILGLSFAQEGKHIQAEPYLAKAAKLNPNDFNALSAYGFTLNFLGKTDEAIKYLKMALKINFDSPQIHGLLGSIYDAKKMYQESDEYFEQALAIDSTDILILNNYAYSLSERGVRLENALKMVKQSVEKEPENSSYLDTIGWVYFKLGDYDKAYGYVKKALEFESNNSVLVEHLGDILFKKGEKEKALDTWKKALELDKDNNEISEKIEKEGL